MGTNVILKGKDTIYENIGDVFEAFRDILEEIGTGDFENIKMDAGEGVIEYDCYGKHIRRVFDMTMNTKELVADVLQWVFSMLDSIANS